MKPTLLASLFIISLGLNSCKEESIVCEGATLTPLTYLFTDSNFEEEFLLDGRYHFRWSVKLDTASVKAPAYGNVQLQLHGQNLQIPVEVSIYTTVNGVTETEIVAASIEPVSAVHSYHVQFSEDLSHIYQGCDGPFEVGLMLSFETTGQGQFDLQYLSNILANGSIVMAYGRVN
jgi:hypothetical protein